MSAAEQFPRKWKLSCSLSSMAREKLGSWNDHVTYTSLQKPILKKKPTGKRSPANIWGLWTWGFVCFCSLRMLRCVCLLLLAASALSHLDEASLDSQWEEWKNTHRREYNGLVSLCYSVLCVKGCRPKSFAMQNKSTSRLNQHITVFVMMEFYKELYRLYQYLKAPHFNFIKRSSL